MAVDLKRHIPRRVLELDPRLALGILSLALLLIAGCDAEDEPVLTVASAQDQGDLNRFLDGEGQIGNRCCSHSVNLVPSPRYPAAPRPRQGDEALRFELRYDDPEAGFGSKRAEITLAGLSPDLGRIGGSNEWYGFSVFLPKSHHPDPAAEIIAQWHARPDQGEVFRGPVLSLHSRDGEWQIVSRHSSEKIQTANNGTRQRLWRVPYQTGIWTDFVFQTRWDWRPDGDGMVNVWMKPATSEVWQEVLAYRGATSYRDERGLYFKAGLYKWPWEGCGAEDRLEVCSGSGSPEPSKVKRRVIYVDEIRVAGGDQVNFEQFTHLSPGEGGR